jgi:hypothetical protein
MLSKKEVSGKNSEKEKKNPKKALKVPKHTPVLTAEGWKRKMAKEMHK